MGRGRLFYFNSKEEGSAWHTGKQVQSGGENGLEGDEAPAREPPALTVMDGGKPSIRQALRDFNPPAPVYPGTDQGQRREAAR